MFIGQFIVNKNYSPATLNPRAYKTIIHNYSNILWYGLSFGGIYEHKYIEHNLEDEDGKYRLAIGGSQTRKDPKALLRTYGDDRIILRDDGKVKAIKFYEDDDIGRVKGVPAVLDNYNIKAIYPTQKPFKLLERIICLSTV